MEDNGRSSDGPADVSMSWRGPPDESSPEPSSGPVEGDSTILEMAEGGEELFEDRKDVGINDTLDLSYDPEGLSESTTESAAPFALSVIPVDDDSGLVLSGKGHAGRSRRLLVGSVGFKSMSESYDRWGGREGDYSAWPNNLFAPLPPPPVKPPEPKQPWPPEARAIARSLLRSEHLRGVKEGLRIEIQTESFDARWDALTGRSQTTALVAPQGWLTVSSGDGSQTSLSWTDAKERGSLAGAMLLGRVRASQPADLQQPPLDLGAGAASPLDLAYVGYSVQLKLEGENRMLLMLTHPNLPHDEIRVLVDTARHVLLKIETITIPSPSGRWTGGEAKLVSTTTFGDFVEIAGAWYAGRIENLDSDGHRTSITTQKFAALPAGEFDRLWKQDLAIRDRRSCSANRCPSWSKPKRPWLPAKRLSTIKS